MNTPEKPVIATFAGRVALFLVAATALFAGGNRAGAATLTTFTPEAPRLKIDFENIAVGTAASSFGWTSADASSLLVAAPRLPASNSGTGAIGADNSTTRRTAISPVQTINPAFTTSDTIYFSAWMNRTTSGSSGGRIFLRDPSNTPGVFLGGFGILDAASGGTASPFALYANSAWHYSSKPAAANAWYEIALVIDMDPSDVTLSLGSLFVRNVTAGETQFSLVEDLSGIPMGYTPSLNATDFSNWRIDSFRNNAQMDNLSAGVAAAAVPEPKTAALALGGLILLGCGSNVRRWMHRGK